MTTRQTPQDGNTPIPCPCQEPENRERVEQMLKLAKTKTDLQELVRALDARNVRLQAVRDQLGIQLAQARLNQGGNR